MTRLIAPGVLVATLCACAAPPVRYAPIGPAAAHLPTSRLPKLTLGEVSDETRGGQFSVHHVGGSVDDPNDSPGTLPYSDAGLAAAVRDALALELQRIGWPSETDPGPRGGRLKAVVVSARADWSAGFGVRVDGKIELELVLEDAGGREVWRVKLDGAGVGTAGAGGAAQNGISDAWNAALVDAMSRLGPELAKDKPWELLGKNPDVPSTTAAADKQWWSKGP